MKNQELEKLAMQGAFFVYDLDKLYKHATQLTANQIRIFFACKANPLSAVIKTLRKAGLHFDVASEGELLQVVAQNILGNHIILTGPAKSEHLLRLALNCRVGVFVIESAQQLQLLQQLAKNYSYKPSVLLRIQLQWDSFDDTNIIGGNHTTHFGIDLETAKTILHQIKLPFLGFHVFQWSNILCINKLQTIWEHTIKTCQTLTKDFTVIDVGGGLGIPYQGEKPISWQSVNMLIKNLQNTYNIPEFWLEMGRYLIGPYGFYMTTVVDRKKTYAQDILILEGGINHIARPALVKEFFPVSLLRNTSAKLQYFLLYGPLCTSLDFLGKVMLPSDVQINDILIFQQAGAYGFTESLPFFLCHKIPGEAVYYQDKIRIIRTPQSAQSWLK
ncbi:Diaminopimelate decarboxylase [Candidatus Xenohaliotis californiensis]|uniref:Diaminopimelate decarboxylase n=1 Tax=Candidatus Xenohaliotis californiensis TaxID=84677 RepID=A0ABP0ESY8_9RICK|nr:Diaminopimelate decarboxylase [Candidatus Xenohaliotis californiensis]